MAVDYSQIDDIDLVRRVQEQSPDRKEAFEEVFNRCLLCARKSVSYLRLNPDSTDGEEIAHDVAVACSMRVWDRQFRSDSVPDGLKNYVRKSVRTAYFKWSERRRRSPISLDTSASSNAGDESTKMPEPGVEDLGGIAALLCGEQRESVGDVIDRLCGHDRWVLIRRFFDNKTLQEMADERAVVVSTSLAWVRRAQKNFRHAWLQRHGEPP